MNLILVHPGEINESGVVCLRDTRARHVREVLGKQPGERVRVGQINGPLGEAVVERVGADEVRLVCAWTEPAPPVPRVDLLLAAPRPKVMKRLWAQLAALGVGRVLVTTAWKVERYYFDSHVLDPDFYTPLLIEGLQQARDTRLPQVSVHRALKPLVEDDLDRLCPGSRRILLEPSAGQPLSEGLLRGSDRLLLAVGPEGGWTPFELDLLASRGFLAARLPLRTLRTDTACLAALALAHALLESFD